MSGPRMPISRRSFLRLAAAGGAAGALGWAGHAQEKPAPAGTDTGAEFITADTQAAIDRGLNALARSQLDDGSFSDRFNGASVGITALAGLALMSAGHQPGRGRYGRMVSKALEYVMASANGPNPGFLTTPESQLNQFRGQGDQRAMYSHGFGCLFLAEACGMLPDPARQRKARGVLEQAVAYTVAAQNREGGWRYDKVPVTADVSVTVAQMMALRAAKNAGVFVRKNVIDAGVGFIRECQMADGGFSYFKGQRGDSSAFARSAAAIVGLYSAGVYEGREIDRGLKYLQQYTPGRQFGFRELPPQHYFYGQYYAALAMWTAGGDYWAQWFPAIRDELVAKARTGGQFGGGLWTDWHGPAYATSMACIILQLPNNYLPIMQK